MPDITPSPPPTFSASSTSPDATRSLSDGVLGCRHQCSSGLRSNCSSLLDPASNHHRLCVVHHHLCHWRASNLCRDSPCWCSHVSPPIHLWLFHLFPLFSRAEQEVFLLFTPFSRAKQEESMPRRLLLISARVGSAGYSHSDHYVALQNLQLADFALITQFRLQLPTSTQTFTHPLKLSGTDSYTAILLPPPLPLSHPSLQSAPVFVHLPKRLSELLTGTTY